MLACASTAFFFLQDVHDVQDEDADVTSEQQNPLHSLSGEQDLPLQMYLEADAGVHVYWHSWVKQDARAQAYMRHTHVHSASCSIDPGDPSPEV